MKNNIAKDTILLTATQLTTQILSLVLNVFINRMLGTENLGLISLINAFFTFAIIISNGNIFVATSRFVAEETGKSDGNPGKIFIYAIKFSLMLSTFAATVVFFSANTVSEKIIKDTASANAIKMLAFSMPLAALSSCFKGYFHAIRKVSVPAISEMISFIIRSCIMAFSAGILIPDNKITIYSALSVSCICSEVICLIFLIAATLQNRLPDNNIKTKGFKTFVKYLFPVMLNSYIPCILSTANDALVPITLKQSGCSTSEALSQYGLFEAVVLPVIFFPSMILSCLSVILIPEVSRHRAGGNGIQNIGIISNVIKKTITYSFFVVSILAVYGNETGIFVSSEEYAGKMIVLLSPVIPFIYLEIVLESIIKGLGKHGFSSLNYLAEYIIRISALLICTPFTGFYGIAISYYLSNIICNIARIKVISKIYEIKFTFKGYIAQPAIAVITSWQVGILLKNISGIKYIPIISQIIIYTLFTLTVYIAILKLLKKLPESDIIYS